MFYSVEQNLETDLISEPAILCEGWTCRNDHNYVNLVTNPVIKVEKRSLI